MKHSEARTNWTPSFLGAQRPDFDGFYRASSFDDERPRDRGGFQLLSAVKPLEAIAIRIEIEPFCDSVIEVDLAVGLTKALRAIDDPTLSLCHQFPLGRFRYDLCLKREVRLKPLVLIECDGKEFHSADDQVANDREKDALAAKYGISLLRFSGSAIFCELDICVAEVFKGLRLRGHIAANDWDVLRAARLV